MKTITFKKSLFFFFLPLILGAALLQAEDASVPTFNTTNTNQTMAPWMNQYDTNKDGKLDENERAAMQRKEQSLQDQAAKMKKEWIEKNGITDPTGKKHTHQH